MTSLLFLRQRVLPILCAAALAAPTMAQVRMQRQPAQVEVKDLNAVYVRDSGVASEKLALAERMERSKEWDKSAAVYQEITDKFADRLLPSRTDKDGQIQQYTGVALVVQERLARWPEDGLRVYRGLYEETARERLAKIAPDDRDGLRRVFGQYFVTESGKQAGLRLVYDSVERGEFSAAVWSARRLLDMHPSLTTERPALLFVSAVAEHLAGNAVSAEAFRQTLATQFADATGTLRGKDVRLADALADELKQSTVLQHGSRLDTWPLPWGTPDNAALPTQVSFGGARMFKIDLPVTPPRGNTRAMRQFGEQIAQTRRNGFSGIMPVVDRGELYFQDNARLYAINLTSGLPLSGWLQTYPGGFGGAFSLDGFPSPRGTPLPVALTDDSVIALMGQADLMVAQQMGQTARPRIVVLDRATGQQRWARDAAGLQVGNEQAGIREGRFYGVPTVVGDTIYALIARSSGGPFLECHAVALAIADGSVKWSSYVASTATDNNFIEFDGQFMPSNTAAQLAYSDGRLYVLTNIGALSCLDAGDGNVAWLNVYPRIEPMNRTARRFLSERPVIDKPFAGNPPIVTGGRVFAAPSDSASLLVYDAVSGEQLATLPRTLNERRDEKFDPVEMLLGVIGNELILSTKSAILAVPWQKYDVSKTVAENDGRYRKFEGGGGSEDEAIRGRPFVSDKHVFVPRVDKLYRLSIAQMRIEGIYPAQGTWEDIEESPGNVLATPDYLIVAGSGKVSVYSDFEVAAAKLDREIAADPRAIDPKLRYAELMLVGGRPADAVKWIDASIEAMGGETGLQRGPLRGRLFDIVITYAVKLQAGGNTNAALIKDLFARARLTAGTAQQQVRYRQSHAAWLQTLNDSAGELALYQQILADAELRRVAVGGKATAATAGGEAELAIAAIARRDPSAYARFEADAETRYQQAIATRPVAIDTLIAVADAFPTTKSAGLALRDAAEAYEQQGKPRDAAHTLRRLLKYADTTQKVTALESLVRVYAAMPGQIDAAIVRSDQLLRLAPQGRLGRPVTIEGAAPVADIGYSDLAARLRDRRRALLDAALPTFGLPPNTGETAKKPELLAPEVLAGVKAIVPQTGPRVRPDRVVAWLSDDKLVQFPAGSISPLHAPVALRAAPRASLYSGDTLVVVGNESLAAILPTGSAAWEMSVNALSNVEITRGSEPSETTGQERAGEDEEPIDVAQIGRRRNVGFPRVVNGVLIRQPVEFVPPNPNETIMETAVLSDRVILATDRCRVAAIDLAGGQVLWQVRLADSGLRRMAATEDFIAVATGDETGNAEVTLLDAMTGQSIRRTAYDPSRGQQFVNLALAGNGTLVTMLGNKLVGRDLYDPAAREWERQASPNVNDQAFANSTLPDQLVITDDRVLAVALNNQQPNVRAYELATGKPLLAQGSRPDDTVEAAFVAASDPTRENAISITAVGPAFYLFGQTALASYHLDKKDWRWSARTGNTLRGTIRDVLIARDYAVLINQDNLANPAAEKTPGIQLNIYSRALSSSGNESGLLERRPILRDPAGILLGQWQLANGAFYYITGDQTLKMVKPNR